jgi:Ferritin-like
MIPKIFPRNLTARGATQVVGNPVNTRLESGVGNCFPGLEFDHRNLDRRFFPGLVFEFTETGVLFLEIDLNDPELPRNSELRKNLAGEVGGRLGEESWFLEEITQNQTTIAMPSRVSDVTMTTWRLVRSLEPGPITIVLKQRRKNSVGTLTNDVIKLEGKRRSFVGPESGVISTAYGPGELSQSLCSPWMHDFRDCACYYWASNHPDIVLAEAPPGESTLPSGAPANPVLAMTPIDWLRSDRASIAPAKATQELNRRAQMDHYDINLRWQELAIVLEGREVSSIYHPREIDKMNPYESADQLAEKLMELATLEHVVALEYLYALYSLKTPEEGGEGTKNDLTFVRHEILFIAVSEMRHLRWVNQLLWSLEHDDMLSQKVGPSLGVANEVPVADDKSRPPQLAQRPSAGKMRPRQLRPLEPDVLQDFISVEQPSGFLDGQYARVLATLRQKKYRETLEQIAARIIGDGMEHYSRFREIQVVLQKYEQWFRDGKLVSASVAAGSKPGTTTRTYRKILRKVTPAADSAAAVAKALAMYGSIVEELNQAYDRGNMEDGSHIAFARQIMFELNGEAETLAARGIGIPFFPVVPRGVNQRAKRRRR